MLPTFLISPARQTSCWLMRHAQCFPADINSNCGCAMADWRRTTDEFPIAFPPIDELPPIYVAGAPGQTVTPPSRCIRLECMMKSLAGVKISICVLDECHTLQVPRQTSLWTCLRYARILAVNAALSQTSDVH